MDNTKQQVCILIDFENLIYGLSNLYNEDELMDKVDIDVLFSLADMLRSTERGIYVTRFHYTRPVEPKQVVITGMTRDGTFLIENGELAYPVKNLRFTQSYLEALNHVGLIGAEPRMLPGLGGLGHDSVPALKLNKFRFTGVTEF